MRKFLLIPAIFIAFSCSTGHNDYDSVFSEDRIGHIAYPVGGLGSGMFAIEGTGAISHMSLHHQPDLFNEPCMYAAIHVDGLANGTKVVEAPVPDYKKYGRGECSLGSPNTTYGLPRFEHGEFSARFPFAKVSLHDDDMPLTATIEAWNPFIPGDEDNSGLPVAGLEYTFTNTSKSEVSAVFSYNSRNIMYRTDDAEAEISPMPRGYVMHQAPSQSCPEDEGHFAIFTPEENPSVDCCWFRGGWFDPFTMAWNKIVAGDTTPVDSLYQSPGASVYVPFSLKAGESRTIKLLMAWYVPVSDVREGTPASEKSDFGDCYSPDLYKDMPETYRPWYATRFASIDEVAAYWKDNYETLKAATRGFTEAFYDSTLPVEVVRAVADNLTILKSSTVMRQHDGRFWAYEGSGDDWGSCHGTCNHVWNYAQALPHLFPRMERVLRETEFRVDQNTEGHQAFRSNLPISPIRHDFYSAADGQLGGIIKVYRDWRISGSDEWMLGLYPQIRKSMDWCIRTWDPRRVGAVEEPHHNTYDIEFWGPDGMCTSFYAGALSAFIKMAEAAGDDASPYAELLDKCREYMTGPLWNGEYFYQNVRWKDLDAEDPTVVMQAAGYENSQEYKPEAMAILEKEGPKYQYGTGCLSDGIIGAWMALCAGLEDPVDPAKVKSHLESVYRYNLKKDFFDIANPQRPGFALGHEGGLLLCSWPYGGKPSLPFVYSDEVWTGIEFQVAAHLMFEGDVEQGLDIVRTCLDRYDGRVRNPFNEYECGAWYSRAMSSYSMLQALTGVRYDAVDHALYIDSRVGNDFRTFLAVDGGYATVGLKAGKPFIEVRSGEIPVEHCYVSGKEMTI
ncbi:MAG: non-lysosomal glucosylceramidase [Bacteroidales bacterium]|nr:non-lysosomal glucosylceramidase [Bacteroidales bacterium]